MSIQQYNPFCISSYLTFRYVVEENQSWKPGLTPEFPKVSHGRQTKVKKSDEILKFLNNRLSSFSGRTTGILLSGGIDSAILAAMLPKGVRAYTIKFCADGAIDESETAQIYTKTCGLDLKVIEVTYEDYLEFMDVLLKRKKSPLHAIEAGLYKAALKAKEDGVETLIVGNGADSTFGGMDKLLSKDWTFDEFIDRYTFVDPKLVVKNPVSMRNVYEKYREGDGINVQKFLKICHGLGIIQTFENAIHAAGCEVFAPYEDLVLDEPLDIQAIRNGNTKYLLRKVFNEVYSGLDIPDKIPFARPMKQWMQDWEGPTRKEVLDDLDMEQFTGEQKWLIFCLERFMEVFEFEGSYCPC